MAAQPKSPRRIRGIDRSIVYMSLEDFFAAAGISRESYLKAEALGIELKTMKAGSAKLVDGNDGLQWYLEWCQAKRDGRVRWDRQREYDVVHRPDRAM